MEEGFINLVSGEKGVMTKNEMGIIEAIKVTQPASKKIKNLGSNSLEFRKTYGYLQDICKKSENGKCVCVALCSNRGRVIESIPLATSPDKRSKVRYHQVQGEVVGYTSISGNIIHSIIKVSKIIWIVNGKETTTLSIDDNLFVRFDIEIPRWKLKNIQKGTFISFQVLNTDFITYKGKWTPLRESDLINFTGTVLDYKNISVGKFVVLIEVNETSVCEVIKDARPTVGEIITFTFNELVEPLIYIGDKN